ncbi:MAG: 2-amino-4-hydroxy-6-hydroxymethyldihydropteridine diphosphokinase [Lentisphaerota bacterium]
MRRDITKVEVGLSLGSNLGDRLANLVEARRRLLQSCDVTIVAQAPVYETEPVGVKPQYRDIKFLNTMLILNHCFTPHDCYQHLRSIEDAMGRQRTMDRYAPRAIDIDVIYAGDFSLESGGLKIPHPHWSERRFVVQPLADVRPDLILPGQTQTVRQILEALPQEEAVSLFQREW